MFWLLFVYFIWELSVHEITFKHVQDFNLFLFIYKQKREKFLCCRKWWYVHKKSMLKWKIFQCLYWWRWCLICKLGLCVSIRGWQILTRCHVNSFWKIFQVLPLRILNLFNVMCSSSSIRKQYFTLHMVIMILHSIILFLLLFLLLCVAIKFMLYLLIMLLLAEVWRCEISSIRITHCSSCLFKSAHVLYQNLLI